MSSILLKGRGQRGNSAGRARGRGRGRGASAAGSHGNNSASATNGTTSPDAFEKERLENAAKRESKSQTSLRGNLKSRANSRGGSQSKHVRFDTNDNAKAGQPAGSAVNPFASQTTNAFGAPAVNSSTANPFGAPSSSNTSQAPQSNSNPFATFPSTSSKPFGTSSTPLEGTSQAVTPFAGFGGNASFESSGSSFQTPSDSSSTFAVKINALLRKNNIAPPAWPASPGNPKQKDAMEKFWHAYKGYRAKARACLIKNGLLDDPDKPKKLSEAIDFKGTCEDMCPEFEKITRIVEHDVQGAEKESSPDGMIPSPSQMIKALARSAAGQDAPLPADVRSPAALRRTLDYLIDTIVGENDLPAVHGFLWNRTRAIRRDFTFQQSSMSPEELIDQVYCLERIARFHVVALHHMTGFELSVEDFSEQQELEQLGKTLLSLIHAYEDCKIQNIVCDNEAEFRAYYVIFNSQNSSILETVQDWGWKFWGESEDVRTAVSLAECLQNTRDPIGPLRPYQSLEIAQNAFSRFFTIVRDSNVSYTMACFAEIHFNKIREAALTSILSAYSMQKGQTKDWTAENLNAYLQFDNLTDVVEFVEAWNLSFEVLDGQECLSFRTAENMQKPSPPLRQPFSESIVERKRGDYSLPDVIHETVYDENTGNEQSSDNEYAASPSVITENSVPGNALNTGGSSLFVSDTSQQNPTTESIVIEQAPEAELFPSKQTTASTDSEFTTNNNAAPANPIFAAPKATSFSSGENSAKSPFFPTDTRSELTATPFGPSSPSAFPATSTLAPAASPFSKLMQPQSETPKPFASLASSTSAPQASSLSPLSFMNKSTPQPASEVDKSRNPSEIVAKGTFNSLPSPAFGKPATFPSVKPLESTAASLSRDTPPAPEKSSNASPSTSKLLPAPSANSLELASDQDNLTTSKEKATSSISSTLEKKSAPQPPANNVPSAAEKAKALKEKNMQSFSKWYSTGKDGILDQFTIFIVESAVSEAMKQFEKEKAELEAQKFAEADAFRAKSLAVKYFYKWRVNAHHLWMRRKGREARELRKRMARDSLRQSMMKRSKLVDEFESAGKRSKRNSMESALLQTGVLNGVHDPDSDAENISRELVGSAPSTPTGSRARSVSSPKPIRLRPRLSASQLSNSSEKRSVSNGTKLAARPMKSIGHSRSRSEDPFRRSITSNSSSFNGSMRHQDGIGRRQRSGVNTDYFRLKARGITTLPDGTPLATAAAMHLPLDGLSLPRSRSLLSASSPRSTPALEVQTSSSELQKEQPVTDIEALKARAKMLMDKDSKEKSAQKRGFRSDDDDEEELFAKAKRIREQMEEGAHWYQTEMAKLSASP